MFDDTIQKITATLTGIRYSGDNNFIIGMFSNETGDFSGLGNMFRPEIGMEYHVFGDWSTHPQYGRQLKFVRYETIQPVDTDGIYKYLVRIARWVGPSIGDKLVEKYGDETLEILRTDPQRVARDIPGLTESRALEIQSGLLEVEAMESIIVELLTILTIPGLRKSLPFDLVDRFGSDAVDMVRENPYVLTEFPGIGFQLADAVALSLHFDQNSLYRKMAATIFTLGENEHEGNVWMDMGQLVENTCNLLGILTAGEAIEPLLNGDKIVRMQFGDTGNMVALTPTDHDETYIAQQIFKLLI